MRSVLAFLFGVFVRSFALLVHSGHYANKILLFLWAVDEFVSEKLLPIERFDRLVLFDIVHVVLFQFFCLLQVQPVV